MGRRIFHAAVWGSAIALALGTAAVGLPAAQAAEFEVSGSGPTEQPFAIPLSEDGGPLDGYHQVLDPDLDRLYVLTSSAEIVVIDSASHTVMSRAPVDDSARLLVLSPDHGSLYAVGPDAIFAYSTADLTVPSAQFALPVDFTPPTDAWSGPRGFVMSADGSRAYSVNWDIASWPPFERDRRIFVFDTSDWSVIDRVGSEYGPDSSCTGPTSNVSNLGLSPTGDTLYALIGCNELVAIDTSDFSSEWYVQLIAERLDPNLTGDWNDPDERSTVSASSINVSPDGRRLYLGTSGSSDGAIMVVDVDGSEPVKRTYWPDRSSNDWQRDSKSTGYILELPSGALFAVATPYYPGAVLYAPNDDTGFLEGRAYFEDWNQYSHLDAPVVTSDGATIYALGASNGVTVIMTPPAPPGCSAQGTALAFAEGTRGEAHLRAFGSRPMTFALAADSHPLPVGIALSPDGVLSGTPSEAGNFAYRVTATNPAGSATFDCAIAVAAAQGPGAGDSTGLDSVGAADSKPGTANAVGAEGKQGTAQGSPGVPGLERTGGADPALPLIAAGALAGTALVLLAARWRQMRTRRAPRV